MNPTVNAKDAKNGAMNFVIQKIRRSESIIDKYDGIRRYQEAHLDHEHRHKQDIAGNPFLLPIKIYGKSGIDGEQDKTDGRQKKNFMIVADHVHSEIDIVMKDDRKISRLDPDLEDQPIDKIGGRAQDQKP